MTDIAGTPQNQTSLRDILREQGIDVDAAALPYFSAKGKAQLIRITAVEPTPPPGPHGYTTFARFRVQDEDGRDFLWDITSKRLLAQLARLGIDQWFNVSKTGSGTATIYDVVPQA